MILPLPLSGFTLYGNVLGSSIYVNNTHDLQVVKAAATFGDNISGNTLQIQFSENGTDWGAYNGSVNFTTGGDTWAADTYKQFTLSGTSTLWTVTDAWKFSTPDALKNLYARVRDAACNTADIVIITTGLSNNGGGDWRYRKPITITGSTAGAQSDYQVRVTLTTAEMENPYSNIKADGSDIRFTKSDGTTELPYWIESWNNAGTSYIWVKITVQIRFLLRQEQLRPICITVIPVLLLRNGEMFSRFCRF